MSLSPVPVAESAVWPPGLFGWMTRRLDDPQPFVSFVRSHAHAQLIFELHKAEPSLLFCTLPNIADCLREEEDSDRRKVRRCRQAVLLEYAKNMHRPHCSSLLLTPREPRREPPPPHRDARRHRSREPRRS